MSRPHPSQLTNIGAKRQGELALCANSVVPDANECGSDLPPPLSVKLFFIRTQKLFQKFLKGLGETFFKKFPQAHPPRPSSAAIIASALYELYWFTKDELYKTSADKMIASLSTEAYRAKVGENGGFILMHSVGSLPHSLLNIEAGRVNDHNIDVPLNYADYYFLEALIRKARVEKDENPIQ